MTEQWIEDDARLAEEIGWRSLPCTRLEERRTWQLAFSVKDKANWNVRCNGEHEYWIVSNGHNWGEPPGKQEGSQGPFASFLEAATTYQLTRGG